MAHDDSGQAAARAALTRTCDKIRAQQRVGEITSAEAAHQVEAAHAQYDMRRAAA
jgi:hypothetical protein